MKRIINVTYTFMALLLSGIVLSPFGCGSGVDQGGIKQESATVTVKVSASDGLNIGKVLVKPIPQNIASVVLDVFDVTTSALVHSETMNGPSGNDPIIFAFNLAGGATYAFNSRAYSQSNGLGVLLYEGTTSGVAISFGANVTVDINLGLVGTLSPTITTNPAVSVTNNSAILTGQVNPHGFETAVYFDWGLDTGYGSSTPIQQVGSGVSTVPVTQPINGLSPETLYHYRLVGSNSGNIVYGGDQQFTTLSDTGLVGVNVYFPDIPLPTVTTNAASNKTATTAQLNATINPHGTNTVAYFEWGQTISYGKTTALVDAGSGNADLPILSNITGLITGTTYNFRVVAYNAGGLTVGTNQVFTSP